jgi:hypothetical protein
MNCLQQGAAPKLPKALRNDDATIAIRNAAKGKSSALKNRANGVEFYADADFFRDIFDSHNFRRIFHPILFLKWQAYGKVYLGSEVNFSAEIEERPCGTEIFYDALFAKTCAAAIIAFDSRVPLQTSPHRCSTFAHDFSPL